MHAASNNGLSEESRLVRHRPRSASVDRGAARSAATRRPSSSAAGAAAPPRPRVPPGGCSSELRRHSRRSGHSAGASGRLADAAKFAKEREARETLETFLLSLHLPKQQTINCFLQRYGLPESQKLFVLDGPDDHIRQALHRRRPGWVENPLADSWLWHLKWRATDCDADYADLTEGELFNHFQGNRDLTTKAGLMRSLRKLDYSDGRIRVESFFPRCYDMSQASDREDFILDFRRCAALQVLRQHKKVTARLADTGQQSGAASTQSEYACNLDVLRVALQVLRRWVKELDSRHVDEERDAALDRHVDDRDFEALLLYSQLGDMQLCGEEVEASMLAASRRRCRSRLLSATGGPSDQSTKAATTAESSEASSMPSDVKAWPQFANHSWTCERTPQLLKETTGLLDMVEERFPQVSLSGPMNAWIVKPGSNSKGSGVMCMHSLGDILHHCGTGSNRVVQKYIEQPLLLFSGRKFDIRQWVLVRSFEPLEVYMFSDCYLRLCSEPFDLGDLSNRQRHISNWSVNRHGKHVTEGAVASLDEFRSELEEITGKMGYWEEHLLPKVKTMILHCLNSVRDTVVQRSSCFEVYGFDIMVDADLNPWLLEVNLSPACESRTPWLAGLLDRMSTRLLDIVIDGRTEPDGKTPDWIRIGAEPQAGMEACPLPDYPPLSTTATTLAAAGDLCVVGRAISVRTEKRFETAYRRKEALQVLQRASRSFLERLRRRKEERAAFVLRRTWQRRQQRKTTAARAIQRVFRRWRRHRRALRLLRPWLRRWVKGQKGLLEQRRMSAVVLQRQAKSFRARLFVQELCTRDAAVRALQRAFRSCAARDLLLHLRATAATLRLQRCWRGILGCRTAAALRRRAAACRLQQWVRQRRSRRLQLVAATRLQARVRGYLQRCRFLSLRASVLVPATKLAYVFGLVRWRRHARNIAAEEAARQVQRAFRLRRCVRWLHKQRSSVQLLQRCWRGYVDRKRWFLVRSAVFKLQHCFRRRMRRAHRAALILQRTFRMRCCMRKMLLKRSAALSLQRYHRGRVARRHLQLARMSCRTLQQHVRRFLDRRREQERVRFEERRKKWLMAYETQRPALPEGKDHIAVPKLQLRSIPQPSGGAARCDCTVTSVSDLSTAAESEDCQSGVHDRSADSSPSYTADGGSPDRCEPAEALYTSGVALSTLAASILSRDSRKPPVAPQSKSGGESAGTAGQACNSTTTSSARAAPLLNLRLERVDDLFSPRLPEAEEEALRSTHSGKTSEQAAGDFARQVRYPPRTRSAAQAPDGRGGRPPLRRRPHTARSGSIGVRIRSGCLDGLV
eukprot:TRINITY_DN49692_c0_g1_i1.p1 TRINITY_DN49692_c0_g1~~TRINITY_DN49692_c0_g1_i1.p1  ORF type:complete len:1309 (-),score=228.17 TRINITY_DN49692_c0_g1_i1:60-3986(-)